MVKSLFKAKLAALFCFAFVSGAHAQTTIGTAVSIDDSVTGNGSRLISTSSQVFANERISANATGLGQFEFNDGTKIVVGPGTSLVFDELIYNPGASTFSKFVLRTTSGAVRFISGGSPSSAYQINTPVGTIGFRGTAVDLQHLRGRTYLLLIDGTVEFCSNGGECELLRRKCDFAVASNSGISDPVQPRNGIFGARDMRNFFPFINDQTELEESFRQRINTCAGGAAAGAPGGGDDSNPGRDLDIDRGTSDFN